MIDFNFIAPALIFAQEKSHWKNKIKLLFFFEDLYKPEKKIYFKKLKKNILSFEFVKAFDHIEPNTLKELKSTLKKIDGVLLSSTASIFRLVYQKQILKRKKIFKNNLRLVAFSNNEFFEEIINILDLIILSGPYDNVNFPEKITRYGLPYWDAFRANFVDLSSMSPVIFNKDSYRVIIPETVIDGDLWYQYIEKYFTDNYSQNTEYFIKARLKTEINTKKFDTFFSNYKKYSNIHYIYDPFFYTTVHLFRNSHEVIFCFPNSNIIRECICCNLKATYLYTDKEYKDSTRPLRLKSAYKDYIHNPKLALKNNITLHANNSKYIFEQIQKLI